MVIQCKSMELEREKGTSHNSLELVRFSQLVVKPFTHVFFCFSRNCLAFFIFPVFSLLCLLHSAPLLFASVFQRLVHMV